MTDFEVKGYKNKCGWLYSDAVKEHFFSPKNLFKSLEEAKQYETEADGIGEVGSPACGDVMKMFIKVKEGKITDCKWQTFGCASAIASTSMLSCMVIGKTLEEAKKIKAKDIVDELGGLPPRKIHCSVLGDQALRAAIENYEGKQK
jgi:NifU-like protein